MNPIPKISQPMELKGYRLVSIFPALSKVYQKRVLKQLSLFIEEDQFIINIDRATEKSVHGIIINETKL